MVLQLRMGWIVMFFVSYALIQMYSECGSIVSARLVFDKMSNKDVVSWSTMIRGYHRAGTLDEALEVIREMHFVREGPAKLP